MASSRLALRVSRLSTRNIARPFTTTPTRLADQQPQPQNTVDPSSFAGINSRHNDTAPEYRRFQAEKPLNPHMTNTTSTISNEMPSLGSDGPPPELITNVDPDYVPKDAIPSNTEKMTGGTQKGKPESGVNTELKVGEIEGGSFRVEPLRRTGEDANTIRARLLCKLLPLLLSQRLIIDVV